MMAAAVATQKALISLSGRLLLAFGMLLLASLGGSY